MDSTYLFQWYYLYEQQLTDVTLCAAVVVVVLMYTISTHALDLQHQTLLDISIYATRNTSVRLETVKIFM